MASDDFPRPPISESEFVQRRDEALLAELTPWERSIVQRAMDNCPGVSLAKIIAELKAFGL